MKSSWRPLSLGVLLTALLQADAAPPPPQNVEPAWIYEGPAVYARLTWSASPAATSYSVYRFEDATSNWIPIATGLTNLMYFDYGAISTPKAYVVTAVSTEGEGAASDMVTVADGEAFPFLHRSPSEFPEIDQRYGWVMPTSARIIWLLPQTSGADGMLEFGTSATNMEPVYFQPNYQMFGHSVTLTNLTPVTPYYYRITSVGTNRVGYSETYFLQTPDTNHPPVATPQSLTLLEDTSCSLTLSATDVEGDALSYTVTAGPSNGTLTGTPPYLTYVPAPNYFGQDSFAFKASDGMADSTETTISLLVWQENDPPVTADQIVTLPEDSFVGITNAVFDPDGDSLVFILVSPPAHGFVSGFGTIYYIADPDFSGTDSFSFKYSDWASESPVATVTAIVTPVNDAPTATNQIPLELDEDTTATVPALVGDVDGDSLTFVFTIPPEHGTVTAVGSNFVYTPNQNYNGWDYFIYQPVDGFATGNIAAVQFHIRPMNDAPIATNRFLVTPEETPVPTLLDLVAEPDFDPVSIIIVSGPSHGTLTQGNFYYTPELNFVGTDSFTFKYNDGLLDGNVATATITVTPVNDPPTANNISVTTAEDTPLLIPLPVSDIDGDALTVSFIGIPAHGTVTGSGLNRTYRPAVEYSGSDSFTYRVRDGSGMEAMGTVAITVTPVNDAPVTIGQSIMMPEDSTALIRLIASDYERDPISVIIVSGPAHGTLSGVWSNLVYTPTANYHGFDEFVYKISDGLLESLPATVDFSITSIPDIPVANPQSTVTPYNTPISITLSGTDGDGDALSHTILSQPANGVLSGTVPNVTFTPTIGWSGNTAFSFRVSDGMSNSSPATVSITVQAPTTVPSAPSGLTATAISSSQINLTWADNSGNNEDGFKIERSTTGNGWTQIAVVGPNVTSYASTGLAANKNYSYRVRAYNVLGNSAYSGSASAKTLR